ncbi:serine/threonine-protein kinase [Streptacidiphilus melanogenes]|uniref:serine/threonine-protein kinase n=1 Tax=Streptacidiphilus melanogenes TaxID=411235 RepID=UPI000AEE8CB2|nr:serine/threonine-protein kinase [Streptacidiphilus melanogenes]
MLAGRYLLGARLGRGGMGTVWRATDQMLDREVAVKELSVGHLAEEDLQIVQSRMKQEARAAARIKHPGVITIHDVVEQDGKPWIVMELIDGRSLSELVEQDGVIDPREAARIGAQVLAALERAHAVGVIHRDVKPANVLLERGTGRVVLTDFGIATFVGDSALTRTGDLVGSPDYLAPERVHGGRPGPESDLWALGATLYAAVEGQSPFRRESPLTTLAAVVTDPLPEPRNAGALAPVLQALMAKEPQERPGASDVRRMLEDVAAGHTTNISLGSLGTGPLRTPTQKVPAVDRQSGPADPDAAYTATVLGTAVNGMVHGGVDGMDGATAAPGSDTAAGRSGGMPTGPTARVPAQGGGFVPASASGAPRSMSGPLYADEAAHATVHESGTGAGAGAGAAFTPAHQHEVGFVTSREGTRAGQPPRRRRRWVWLLVAALVAGAGGAGATYWYNHRHQNTGAGGQDHPSTSPTSVVQPSSEPVQIPSGYQLTHDPYGFSFGLPVGGDKPWMRSAPKGSIAITYTPDGIHKIIFGVTYANSRTAVQQGQWLMEQLKQNDKSYEPVRFSPNSFKNSTGAQLEFYFVDAKTQQKMHAMEQFYKAPNGNEYDTFISYPIDDWGNGYGRFEEILQTLTVP